MRGLSLLVLLCVLASAAPVAGAGHDIERRFSWHEANARMAVARTQAEYLAAAEAYQRLVDAGVRNGPICYNLGTALLKAERFGEALAALERAERYVGADPDVRRNMRLALAGQRKLDEAAALPAYRYLFFWHYDLAGGLRVSIAVVAFSLCWVALALRSLGVRRIAARLLTLSAVVLALAGSSALMTIYHESRADQWRDLARQARLQSAAERHDAAEDETHP